MTPSELAQFAYYTHYIRNHMNGVGKTSSEKASIYLDRIRIHFEQACKDAVRGEVSGLEQADRERDENTQHLEP